MMAIMRVFMLLEGTDMLLEEEMNVKVLFLPGR